MSEERKKSTGEVPEVVVAVRSGEIAPAPRRRAPRRPDPFDEPSAARWLGVLRGTVWRYFRPTVVGASNLPAGRALVVGCHSGVIPYDAACLFVAIHDATGRYARFVGDNLFGRAGAVARFLERQGAVVGRPDVVESLLDDENLVLLFPGGSRDMTRPYLTQRYRVNPHRGYAPGRGGYIKIALRTGSPIVPLAVVGAEEAHVMLGDVPPLARAVTLPFFPVVLFPLPLPARFIIRFGRPIRLDGTPADASDQATVDRLNEMVRRRVQSLIDDTRRRRRGVFLGRYDDRPPAPRRAVGRGREADRRR